MVVQFCSVVAKHDLIELPRFANPLLLAQFSGHLHISQRCFKGRSNCAGKASQSSAEGSVDALGHRLVELIPKFWRYPSILAEAFGIGASDTVGLAANVVVEINLVRRQLHLLNPSQIFLYLKLILDELPRYFIGFLIEAVVYAAGVKQVDPVCDQQCLVE